MALNALLEDEGYTVRWFSDTDAAATHVETELPDLVVADWQLDGALSSAALAQRIRERKPEVVVAFVTGYSVEDLKGGMPPIGEYLHFSKPLDYDEFILKLKSKVPPK
jgi:DNA-binding response OmpR family regulator